MFFKNKISPNFGDSNNKESFERKNSKFEEFTIKHKSFAWRHDNTNIQNTLNNEDIERRIACIHRPIDALLLTIGLCSFSIKIFQVFTCSYALNQVGGFMGSLVLILAGLVNIITLGALSVMIVLIRLFGYTSILFIMFLQIIMDSIHIRRLHYEIYIQKVDPLSNCNYKKIIFYAYVCILLSWLISFLVAVIGLMLTIDELIQTLKYSVNLEHNQINDMNVVRGLDL